MREQDVDRIVRVHDLEALTGELAGADLGARVVGDDGAVVEAAPDAAAVRVGDVLREIDHHEVLGTRVDRVLVLAALGARRADLLDEVARELALGAGLARGAERDELGLEERARGGVIGRGELRCGGARLSPLLRLAAVAVVTDGLVVLELRDRRARLEERGDGFGVAVVGPAR